MNLFDLTNVSCTPEKKTKAAKESHCCAPEESYLHALNLIQVRVPVPFSTRSLTYFEMTLMFIKLARRKEIKAKAATCSLG